MLLGSSRVEAVQTDLDVHARESRDPGIDSAGCNEKTNDCGDEGGPHFGLVVDKQGRAQSVSWSQRLPTIE